jgi:pimeloyl-[acyl-carrier protein] methyl ester esterase
MGQLQTPCGKQVYYEDHGNGDSVLLLIHGWGMSVRCWDPILPALRESKLRVVTMDHRGCGSSDKDFADVSIGAIAADVAALVAHLGISRVVLNGWSLGGAVAVQAASNLGAVCTGLVLTGGATPLYTQKPDFPHGGTAEDMAGTLAAYAENRVDFLQGLSTVVCAREVGANIENWFYRIFLQASPMAGATLGELAQLDQRELLKGLDMPILSLFGSEDGFVEPMICRWVADNHPRAKGVEFPGVGHAPFIEEREGYLNALIEFVGESL